jgi:transcription antitermination factor NusG
VPRREALALHYLGLAGYEVYLPRLREHRTSRGRKIEVHPPLFPGYAFIAVKLQWHSARWSVGVVSLIMNGGEPARVPDDVIEEIRSRERNGLIELPKASLASWRHGTHHARAADRPSGVVCRHEAAREG